MAQMHSQIPIGNLSLVDMPFAIPELVIFKVPLLMVHSVPRSHAPTGSKILLSASLTPMMILLPPQDPPRPLQNQICLGLLTGAALYKNPFHATLLRPPPGIFLIAIRQRTRRQRRAVVRNAAKKLQAATSNLWMSVRTLNFLPTPSVPHAMNSGIYTNQVRLPLWGA